MAVAYNQFESIRVQAVAFTTGDQIIMQRLLVALLNEWGDLFSSEPVVLPNNIPAEVPRIILKQPNQQYSFEVYVNRIVLTWDQQDLEPFTGFEEFTSLAVSLFSSYLTQASTTAGRLGVIIQRVATAGAPATELVKQFYQERWVTGPLNRPAAFEFGALKQFALAHSIPVNSWFRCRTGERLMVGDDTTVPESRPCILVEQDINTPAEAAGSIVYEPPMITEFLNNVCHEANDVLRLYFPGDAHDTVDDQRR